MNYNRTYKEGSPPSEIAFQQPGRKVFRISREELSGQIEQYLKSGGTIKKIRPVGEYDPFSDSVYTFEERDRTGTFGQHFYGRF